MEVHVRVVEFLSNITDMMEGEPVRYSVSGNYRYIPTLCIDISPTPSGYIPT